jgi:hypothetical protein
MSLAKNRRSARFEKTSLKKSDDYKSVHLQFSINMKGGCA